MNIKTNTLTVLLSVVAATIWSATAFGSNEASGTAVAKQDRGNSVSAASRWPAVIATGVHSSDLDRSLRFYTQVLGMTVRRTVNKGDKTEVMLGFPGKNVQAGISLMHTQGDNTPVEHGNIGVKVILGMPDVEAVAERMTAAGFTGIDLRQHSKAKILIIRDPDGYKYEIIDINAVTATH